MFKFSNKSLEKLASVDVRLQTLAKKVLEITPIDFAITCGSRNKAEQEQLVKEGKSKTLNSKHLVGKAIDIMPCKEKYTQAKDIFILVGLFIAVAKQLNINIRVGALWDYNSTKDNNFILTTLHFVCR